MRLISITSAVVVTLAAFAASGTRAGQGPPISGPHNAANVSEGQQIFRYDTFGSEQLWTDTLRLHEAIESVSPRTALAVGLKVDVDALPPAIIAALQAGAVDLDDPAVTLALLSLDAVVGVRGTVEGDRLTSIGITCALCHSTVDDSFTDGIGRRLDGWAATDLNVGAIVSLSPVLSNELKDEFGQWGPGMYDPRHHYFDGENIQLLNEPSVPVVIPPIYGLRGVEFETFTGDGPISYWNAYVGIGQMGGKGNFSDPRLPLTITQDEDLVTPKLPALLEYQLRLRAPKPPAGSFDPAAAGRGRQVFRDAGCATCHRPPNYTDVVSGPDRDEPFLHDPLDVGQDPTYADRSATGKYRTTPLRALFQHAPYFHDGSAKTLGDVVDHYEELFGLGLTAKERNDLVEFLKSL